MNSSLKLYEEEATPFLNADFELKKLSGDCRFTEGPVWNEEGFYLFSDIDANTVYRISEDGQKTVYIPQSGTDDENNEDLKAGHVGSNALAYDNEGTLLVCRHGSHQIAKWDGEKLVPYLDTYNGRPFNSPNDLVASKAGSVFFSDPPYGLKDGKPNPQKFQPVAGVYCFMQETLTLFCDRYQYPNGVCLTPDQSELFICSSKPFERFISVYDAQSLQFKRNLAEENSDGIKCDPQGNVYLCTKEGLVVLSKEGKRLALIALDTIPANCCWGGPQKKDLLVTARENVFLLKNLLR